MKPLADQFVSHLRLVDRRDPAVDTKREAADPAVRRLPDPAPEGSGVLLVTPPGAGSPPRPGREATPDAAASLPAGLPSPGACRHPGGRGEIHSPGRHHKPEPTRDGTPDSRPVGSAAGRAGLPPALSATQTTPSPRGRGTGVGRAGGANRAATPAAHPVRLTARGRRVARAAGWLLAGLLGGAGVYVIGGLAAGLWLLYGPN